MVITKDIRYIGVNDHQVDLFEGQYVVPNGMAYNSYVILDEKVAVMDTIDASKTTEWLENVKKALAGRQPDYLVVQHMEPDHAASVEAFVNTYPQVTVVANKKTFVMIAQFFPNLKMQNTLSVENFGIKCISCSVSASADVFRYILSRKGLTIITLPSV